MKLVIDLVLVAILVLCGWAGYKKGLIMGIGGILVIVVSIYGANLLSNTFSYEVVDAMHPFADGYMDKVISEEVRPSLDMTDEYSVADYLQRKPELTEDFSVRTYEALGIYEKTAEALAAEAREYRATQGGGLVDAMVDVLCLHLSYVLGFSLFFLLILIVLTVIGNLPNLSYRIPNLDSLNDIGGTVLGALTGFFYCTLLAWALKFTGIIISQATLSDTVFAAWLIRMDIIGHFLGI